MPFMAGAGAGADWGARTEPPQETAAFLVHDALKPDSVVDFPQITEICERLEAEPGEMLGVAGLLVAALRDARTPVRTKLQALTIANEMMYNQDAVEAFRATDGTREAIESLRGIKETDLGPITEDLVRTLANECGRSCFTCSSAARARPGTVAGDLWTPWSTSIAMRDNLQKMLQRAASCHDGLLEDDEEPEAAARRHRREARALFKKKDFAGAAAKRRQAAQLLRGPVAANAIRGNAAGAAGARMESEFGLVVLGELGLDLLMQGDFAGALGPLEEALRGFRITRSVAGHPMLGSEVGAQIVTNVGTARAGLRDFKGALVSFEEALHLRQSLDMMETQAGARLLRNTGWARLSGGDARGALRAFAEAGLLLERLGAHGSEDGARSLHGHASARAQLGDRAGALRDLGRARQVLATAGLLNTPFAAEVSASVASVSEELRAQPLAPAPPPPQTTVFGLGHGLGSAGKMDLSEGLGVSQVLRLLGLAS